MKTEKLTLIYSAMKGSDGKFNADDLHVSFSMQGKNVIWYPGMPDTGNLQGTTRTLDGALGSTTDEPIGPGLISRNGWVLVDDTKRPLFDGTNFQFLHGEKSTWPWVMLRPAGDRQDWYFFGYGHHYKEALGDFVQVAGRIPLPPRFAFGAWWSRYWAYSDQELDDLVRGFHENNVPLDVLVIDMDWHPTMGQLWWNSKNDASGHTLVYRNAGLVQKRGELEGFAGDMTRLREAYDTLNRTFPLGWSPDSLIDAMQTGDRLTYHPETAQKELAHFRAELPIALDQVRKLEGAITQRDLKRIVGTLGANWNSSIHMTKYQDAITMATTQIEDAMSTKAAQSSQ